MNIDYELGMDRLCKLVSKEDWYRHFNTLAIRLRDNIQNERKYGSSDLSSRYQIIEALDRLTIIRQFDKTFTELCSDSLPLYPVNSAPTSPIIQQSAFSSTPENRNRQIPSLQDQQQHEDSSSSHPQFDSTRAGNQQQPVLLGTHQHWAVLVGANMYEDEYAYGSLNYCAQDATSIYQQLLVGGFTEDCIHLLTDNEKRKPRREEILAALKTVANHSETDDLLLFYFSGHGEVEQGICYLIPSNGRRINLVDTAVPINRVKEIMEQAQARAKVIILDACHSGANIGTKGARPMPEQFFEHVIEHASGLAIISSCTQGQLSYEWIEKQCGAFTYYLLEALRGQTDPNKGYVTVQDVNQYVSYYVKLWANKQQVMQTPTLHYVVVGDILLARCNEEDKNTDPLVPQTQETLLVPHLTSAYNYISAVERIIRRIQEIFSKPTNIYEFQLENILQSFRDIEKPTVFQSLTIALALEPQLRTLTIELHYLDQEMRELISHIKDFGNTARKTQRYIRKQKEIILKNLPSLQRRVENIHETIDTLQADKPPGSAKGGEEGTKAGTLTPYIGDSEALRKGYVHQELTHLMEELGVKLGIAPVAEDMLERYKCIPLHALFLYTTEDNEVGSYIANNWKALDSLSSDVCDIHPIVNQFKNAEDAYDYIKKLDMIRQANFQAYPQIPGLFFWDHLGKTEYISFGEQATYNDIKHVIRTVFGLLQQHPTLTTVKQARQVLEREKQMSQDNRYKEQKKTSSWSDLFIILIALLIIIGGIIAIAQFISPLLFGIALIAALLFLVLIITWLLRRSNDLTEGNFVKIVLRLFNALPLLRDRIRKEEHHSKSSGKLPVAQARSIETDHTLLT